MFCSQLFDEVLPRCDAPERTADSDALADCGAAATCCSFRVTSVFIGLIQRSGCAWQIPESDSPCGGLCLCGGQCGECEHPHRYRQGDLPLSISMRMLAFAA